MDTSHQPKICLILQGGGALGAYHIGAFEALNEAGLQPDWFAGISIGAINAALLAGNQPPLRLSRLEQFWDSISWPGTDLRIPATLFTDGAAIYNSFQAGLALTLGQPNFYMPRPLNPWLNWPGSHATSFYDFDPLKKTLGKLCDFHLINSPATRLTVGATRITDGELVFFDSANERLGSNHILASAALPPGFPAVEIANEWYWDGGVVSNTPLEGVLAMAPDEDWLIFIIDLWNPTGALPKTMSEVLWRQKEIAFASRTRHQIESCVANHNLQAILQHCPGARLGQQGQTIKAAPKVDIVHLAYQAVPGHIPLSDAEFSRRSIRLRRQCGYEDMQAVLQQAPWNQERELPLPFRLHRRQALPTP